MANASTTGFGLRMVMNVGNTPATSGQSEYKIQTAPGVASNKGDPMSVQSSNGDQGYIQDAAFTVLDDGGTGGNAWANNGGGGGGQPNGLCIGVFNGAFFIDSTGKPTFSNNVVAAQATSKNYNTGSNDIIAFVNDNPQQEYVCKADAAVAQTAIGTVFNCNNFTASDAKSGQSTVTLDITSAAETKMFRVVGSANEIGNDDMASAGANVRVAWNSASNLYQ